MPRFSDGGAMGGRGLVGWRLPYAVVALLLPFTDSVIGALPEEAVFVPGTLPVDTDGNEVPVLHLCLRELDPSGRMHAGCPPNATGPQ